MNQQTCAHSTQVHRIASSVLLVCPRACRSLRLTPPSYDFCQRSVFLSNSSICRSTRGEKTIIGNLMAQNLVEDPVFAFYMADDGSGELTIGKTCN
jgi:hypothetical protein